MRGSEVEKEWDAHYDIDRVVISPIRSIGSGTRVVTGSSFRPGKWSSRPINHPHPPRSRVEPVKVWDIESVRCIYLFTDHQTSVRCVAMTDDGRWAAYGCEDGTFQVLNVDTDKVVAGRTQSHHGSVELIEFMENGRKLLTGEEDGLLRIWDTTRSTQVGSPFEDQSESVTSVALCAGEKRLVGGCLAGTVIVWDVGSRQQIRRISKLRERVSCVAMSADGSRVTCDNGSKIEVWDVDSGTNVCDPLTGHSHRISGVSFLEDENSIVSCSKDGSVRVWDINRRNTERVSDQHNGDISRFCFTPDGKFLVSGSSDKAIRIWDTESGELIGGPLWGHTDRVIDVAVTPDGRSIMSVSNDKTVRFWDLQTRSLLHTFTGNEGSIECVAISPNGDRAVTRLVVGTVLVWDL